MSQLWAVEEAAEPTGADGRPLTTRGARTRQAILDAAERVFADLGYHDASIVKITEAASVAQGTFYLYFESKQQVFDELVRDLNRRVRHAMSEHAADATTIETRPPLIRLIAALPPPVRRSRTSQCARIGSSAAPCTELG